MLSNIDIVDLEKKVFRYRLKQKLHYIILFFLSLFISGIILYFYYNPFPSVSTKETIPALSAETNISIVKPEFSIVKEEIKQKIPSPEIVIEEKMQEIAPVQTLMLQLPIIRANNSDKKNSNLPIFKEPLDKKFPHEIVEDDIENKVLMRKMSTKAEDTFYRNVDEAIEAKNMLAPPLEDEKPKGLIRIETQEVNSIAYLKDKFEKTQNIIFALMLSEEYYLNKNYGESNKWALIANGIDSDNEKSWVWFAKSKVKLGQKEDAIVALKAYLKNNKSKTIESLLSQINIGEIQ